MRRTTPAVLFGLLGLLLVSAAGARQPDLGTEEQRVQGKQLYDKYCSQCHGLTGDGQGWATPRVKPAPRDFTSGKYKFRTTPSGTLPTDADIARVIRIGLPYTSMPGWPIFDEGQIQNLVYYLKTFSADFADPEKLADPIEIPQPPPSTEESVARGRQVYEAQGCAACHGDLGRGDGLSAPTLKDDWGQHIRPADMTLPWTFRGGATKSDMFRTFSTGLNGTPMPSYGDSLAVEDRWDLVNYMDSLSPDDEPRYAELLTVAYVEDELDPAEAEGLFAQAPEARFPLLGQIIQSGRDFYPSTSSIRVQAVHNNKDIAFRLRWNDMRAETAGANDPLAEVPPWQDPAPRADAAAEDDGGIWGDEEVAADAPGDFWGAEAAADDSGDFWGEAGDGAAAVGGAYSDAVALQFPNQKPTGIRKPYFLFGDTQGAVDLWFVDLAKGEIPQQFTGRGRATLERSEGEDLVVSSSYDKGEWTVLLQRSLRSSGGISFAPNEFTPIAFSVWDGFNEERGNKRALSAWFHLYVTPTEVVSPLVPMIRAGLLVLLAELLLIFFIRRKYAPRASGRAPAGATLPEREVTA